MLDTKTPCELIHCQTLTCQSSQTLAACTCAVPDVNRKRQLTINLSKTEAVVFEARQSGMCDFVLSGAVVEQVESYKYLGFVVHATKTLTFGADALVATAKKAFICCETAMCTSGHTRSRSAVQAA